MYSPLKINKYFVKILYMLNKFGYSFLNKNKFIFLKTLKKTKMHLNYNNYNNYKKFLNKYKKFSIKNLSISEFTNFIKFYGKYLFINRKNLSLLLFNFNSVNNNLNVFINKFLRGSFYSFGFYKVNKSNNYYKKISKLWSWTQSISKKHFYNNLSSKKLFIYSQLYKKIINKFKNIKNLYIVKYIFFFVLFKFKLSNFSNFFFKFFILLFKYMYIFLNNKYLKILIKKFVIVYNKKQYSLNNYIYNIVSYVKLFNYLKFLRNDYLFYMNNHCIYDDYLFISFNSFN